MIYYMYKQSKGLLQMPKTVQKLRFSQKRRKSGKNKFLKIIPLAIILICILATAFIFYSKNTETNSDITADNTPIASASPSATPETESAVAAVTSSPTATATPTPVPVTTPSPTDPSKSSPENPADLTRVLIVNNADATEKTAYLTFDDGPSPNTELILSALEKYNAKATFFVVGTAVEKYPELVKKIYDGGHSIGNHSYSHEYDSVYGTPEQFLDEIKKNEALIGDIIGHENVLPLFRFPGGSFGEKREPFRKTIATTNYKYVDWNALNSDADGKPFTAERGLEEIKTSCADAGDVIILMHDTAAKTITAESLPQVLDYLISQGYKLERIVP